MHDARFLLPSDHVGFASFFNASDNYNVQFVYGNEKTSDGTAYYVARAVAKEDILKGTIMTADYSYAPFQALKTDVLLNSEQCNNDLKAYILGHYARLDQVFVCRSTSPSSGKLLRRNLKNSLCFSILAKICPGGIRTRDLKIQMSRR